METEHTPPAPTIALLLTEERASALTAAISHYRTHAKRHPELELDQAVSILEELQRDLINEAREPTIPPRDVEAVWRLSHLNRARRAPNSRRSHALFSNAYAWLVFILGVPVHPGRGDDQNWHFGSYEAAASIPKRTVSTATSNDALLATQSKPRKMTLSEAREAIEQQGKIASISIPIDHKIKMIHNVSKDERGFLYRKIMFHYHAGAAPDGEERYETWEDVLAHVPHADNEEWMVFAR